MIWFEDDVVPFFREHSDSIYLRDLNQSFDRLLHAVCQYLNLVSKSRDQYLPESDALNKSTVSSFKVLRAMANDTRKWRIVAPNSFRQ